MSAIGITRTRPQRPGPAPVTARTIRNYVYDFDQFLRTSFLTETRNREHRRASLHILAHSIEHGMSLTDPRIGFGFAKVTTLLAETRSYFDLYGLDDTAAMTLKVLDAYATSNGARGGEVAALRADLDALETRFTFRCEDVAGGTEDVRLDAVRAVTDIGFLPLSKPGTASGSVLSTSP